MQRKAIYALVIPLDFHILHNSAAGTLSKIVKSPPSFCIDITNICSPVLDVQVVLQRIGNAIVPAVAGDEGGRLLQRVNGVSHSNASAAERHHFAVVVAVPERDRVPGVYAEIGAEKLQPAALAAVRRVKLQQLRQRRGDANAGSFPLQPRPKSVLTRAWAGVGLYPADAPPIGQREGGNIRDGMPGGGDCRHRPPGRPRSSRAHRGRRPP